MQTAPPTSPPPAGTPGRSGLPGGAARMSRTYYDTAGVERRAAHDVPVDQYGVITAVQYRCRQHGPAGWFPAQAKHAPTCERCGRRMVAMEVERAPLLPWRDLWAAADRPLRPVWALVAAGGAAVAVDAADLPPLVFAGMAPVAGWVARRIVVRELTAKPAKGRFDFEVLTDEERLRAAIGRVGRGFGYVTAGGFAAFAAVAALGVDLGTWPGRVAAAVAFVAWLAPAAWWWRADRRAPAAEPMPAPAPVPTSASPSDADVAANIWRLDVAVDGTELDRGSWRKIKGGWQAVIVATKRGALNALGGDNMTSTVKRIAAGFDVPRAAVGWIDEYEGSPNRALLLVQPNSPLRDNITWQPPGVLDVDRAFLHMGMKITGDPLRTRLWTPGWGAPSRFIVGTKGSGKTEALRLLLLGMLEAKVASPDGPRRLIAPFLHDPKRGKDFGAFRRQVSGFSTDPEMLHLIVEALIREMDRRYDSLGSDVWFDEHGRPREGETAFDPSIHGPILSLVVDEFHEPAKDQLLMGKLEPMARKMRAAGIEIVAATHMSTIGDSGSQVFRDMLAGGEAWLFRTTSALNASLATGGQLVGDPRGLPREPGSVLFASGDDDTMQSRVAYVPSEPLYNRLYDEHNRSRIMPVEWPPETLEAFGPEFVQWMRECQARNPGDPAPALPKRLGGPSDASPPKAKTADARCVDAVLSALAGSPVPLGMDALQSTPVVAAGGWSTRAIRAAIQKLRDEAGLVFTTGAGPSTRHELTPQARADIERQLAAQIEEAAARAEEAE
ncbi:hypothetical protein [Dactylosporangium sp. CA-139066]|uniref:hypothetical protein n=1 Tax=Dactylosporangium sp. CA-139066 TaxID=3239930 RepID=UPI003D94BB28